MTESQTPPNSCFQKLNEFSETLILEQPVDGIIWIGSGQKLRRLTNTIELARHVGRSEFIEWNLSGITRMARMTRICESFALAITPPRSEPAHGFSDGTHHFIGISGVPDLGQERLDVANKVRV